VSELETRIMRAKARMGTRAVEIGDRSRFAVEGAVANHRAGAVVEVEHRGEAEIHAAGAQLRRKYPTGLVRQGLGAVRMFVPDMPQLAHRRQAGEAVAESLHPTAFMVHGNQQMRVAQGMNLGGQPGKLRLRGVIPAEQDHPADQWVLQSFPVLVSQFGAENIEHYRAKSHFCFSLDYCSRTEKATTISASSLIDR